MGHKEHIEPHRHPDLAVREKHLNDLIAALKKTGMQVGGESNSGYHAGYASFRADARFKSPDGFSVA